MSYPASLDSFVNKVDNFDDVMANDINELQNSIMAMQSFFGTQIQYGWLPLPAGTYVSATSFTLPGDWAAFLKMGAKFKCTNSTAKYGLIESSSYNSGTGKTTVYLMASLSGALANAAISGAYISYATPPDFPSVDPLSSGWVPSQYIWTYVSANSFKVTGVNATEVFQVGAKLRCKQGSGWIYAYVAAASFSTDTLVTIAAGRDYSLANAYITDTFISYSTAPQGFPGVFNYNPVWTADATNPSLGNGTLTGILSMTGRKVLCQMDLTIGGTTTFGSGAWKFSVPILASALRYYLGLSLAYDSSPAGQQMGLAQLQGVGYLSPYAYNSATRFSATVPFTWAQGDVMRSQIEYFV